MTERIAISDFRRPIYISVTMLDDPIGNRKSEIENRLGPPTRRNWLWFSCQVVLRLAFLVWLRYRAIGTRHIPESGGGLVIGNHQSFLDPLLIALPLNRPVSYIARDSLFRVPVVGWILRKTYVMPINRDGGSPAIIKETIRRMDAGFLCGVFPEGTRSRDGTVADFKPGFIALVRRGRLPIFPVGIAGANRAFGRGSWFIKPRRVCVVFGEPLAASVVAELSAKGREAELVSLVRERVIVCQREAERRLNSNEQRDLSPLPNGGEGPGVRGPSVSEPSRSSESSEQ